jgi:hypothetical protein
LTFKATGFSIIDALNKLNEEMFRYNKHYIIDSYYEMQQWQHWNEVEMNEEKFEVGKRYLVVFYPFCTRQIVEVKVLELDMKTQQYIKLEYLDTYTSSLREISDIRILTQLD